MQRIVRLGMALIAVATLSACVAFPGRHGGVRVGVVLPVPVIRIPIPGPSYDPPPQPMPAPPPAQPQSYPSYPGNGGYPSNGYPSAGQPPAHGHYGVVRGVEAYGAYGRGTGLRVAVQMDSGAMRAFDVPQGYEWRVGDRVRVEGHQLFRG